MCFNYIDYIFHHMTYISSRYKCALSNNPIPVWNPPIYPLSDTTPNSVTENENDSVLKYGLFEL